MRVSLYHVTGNDHMGDPAWGDAPIWQGDVDEVERRIVASSVPLDQLVVGLPDLRTVWAADFLADRR